VADLITWLCADLPPAGQREKIEWLGPRLLERICKGRIGLPLVVYYHLLRLPNLEITGFSFDKTNPPPV